MELFEKIIVTTLLVLGGWKFFELTNYWFESIMEKHS